MSKPPSNCIFCGQRPLTKEHMYADWLRNYIPRVRERHAVLATVDFPQSSKENIYTRQGDPHVRKIKCVCADCNNNWMSQSQEAVKPYLIPLIQGKSASLNRKSQTLVASWAAMMVMVSEYLNTDMVAVPQSDRTWFKVNRKPPSHWRIWIGSREPNSRYSLYSHDAISFTKNKLEILESSATYRSNTQVSTICVGEHLVFYVMSSQAIRHIIRRWKLPPAIAPLFAQIWPVQSTFVGWPLARPVTDKELDIVAHQLYRRAHRVAKKEAGITN